MSRPLKIKRGKKVFSQNDEDGILESIFDVIGFKTAVVVEIGCWPDENNTENLRLRYGVDCFRFDLDPKNEYIIKEEFSAITAPTTLAKHGVPHSYDLLSLDIDGQDYWVLKSILMWDKPRVICVEYNAPLGWERSVTVPQSRLWRWDGTDWFGASFQALCQLMLKNGYIPVACDSTGVNLFGVSVSAMQNVATEEPGYKGKNIWRDRGYHAHPVHPNPVWEEV